MVARNLLCSTNGFVITSFRRERAEGEQHRLRVKEIWVQILGLCNMILIIYLTILSFLFYENNNEKNPISGPRAIFPLKYL